MGENNKSSKQGVILTVGILMALAVFGSFVDAASTVNNGGFHHLRF